ncbi:MAG: class I SAM-dependent methyltransferase [Actinobacteria bacterium]|nr:class I SAM-dependent methyltransferase [Actinomycetota bacterium]
MDIWKYFDITHEKHILLNPISRAKFDGLLLLLNLKPNWKALDIACGKGELLIRLAELFNISGIGVDISPYFIKDCKERKNERIPNSDIKFLEMDGSEYRPKKDELFDLTVCMGASFVYKGFLGTIDALKKMTKPYGLIIIGEPYWLKEPNDEYLKMSGMKKDEFNSHYKNIDVGEKEGLNCIYTLVSNHDDWDHYETLQWWSANEYVINNPSDPDNAELLDKINKTKMEYLLNGRDTLGWAIYVFKKQ